MTYDPMRRPPIVTDIDRQWAIDQKPTTWDADVLSRWLAMSETTRPDEPLTWETHVAEQVERFEAQFCDDRKPSTEWGGFWRRWWWPKADPSILHPREAPAVPHPFVRRGDRSWSLVLEAITPDERRVAERFGVMQFRPDDERASLIAGGNGRD